MQPFQHCRQPPPGSHAVALERGADGSPPCGMLVHVPHPLNCQPCCRADGKERNRRCVEMQCKGVTPRMSAASLHCCTAQTMSRHQQVLTPFAAAMLLTYGHSSLPSGVMRPSDSGTCTVGAGTGSRCVCQLAQRRTRRHIAACATHFRSGVQQSAQRSVPPAQLTASAVGSPAGGGRHRRSSGAPLAGPARSHCIAGSWQRGGWACQKGRHGTAGTAER